MHRAHPIVAAKFRFDSTYCYFACGGPQLLAEKVTTAKSNEQAALLRNGRVLKRMNPVVFWLAHLSVVFALPYRLWIWSASEHAKPDLPQAFIALRALNFTSLNNSNETEGGWCLEIPVTYASVN